MMFSFTITKPDGDNHYVMQKKSTWPLRGVFLKLALCFILCILPALPHIDCLPARAIFLDVKPIDAINIRRAYYPPINKRKSPKRFYSSEEYDYEPSFLEEDSFSIGPGDAVTNHRYSPSASVYPSATSNTPKRTIGQKEIGPANHKEVYIPHGSYTSSSDRRNPVLNSESIVTEETVTSNYKVDHEQSFSSTSNKGTSNSSLKPHLHQNNFTISNNSHVIIASDTVLSYHPPPVGMPKYPRKNDDTRIQTTVYTIPNSTAEADISVANSTVHPLDNIDIMLKDAPESPSYNATDRSDLFSTIFTTETVFHTTDIKVTLTPTANDTRENVSEVLPPIESTKAYKFSSGAVAGIVIAVLTCVTVVTSSVIYLLYRKYNGHCSGVVDSKFNSDNCGYLDDSIRSSVYLNNHIELPKENSEEMTSLDNDSFLNSLETMTIQNYWADNTKNTKV